MRSSLVLVFLLVLHLLICGAYGSRLGKFGGSWKSGEVQVAHKDEDHGALEGESNRKLVDSATSSTSMAKPIQDHKKVKEDQETNKLNLAKGGKDERSSTISSSPLASPDMHREVVASHHKREELLDMTEMDYSPATRKAPIHN